MKLVNSKMIRRIFFILIILLLVSLCYLALDVAVFLDGEWQLVQGQDLSKSPPEYIFDQINLPNKMEYPTDYWEILHAGKLFFKTPLAIPSVEEPVQVLPDKQNFTPTCPWVLKGILWADNPSAILAHQQSQQSLTVRIGRIVDGFKVIAITKDYVIVKSLAGEFRLELGGR